MASTLMNTLPQFNGLRASKISAAQGLVCNLYFSCLLKCDLIFFYTLTKLTNIKNI